MNPVVLYFASGESLYSGAALLLLLIAINPIIRNRWLLRCRRLAALEQPRPHDDGVPAAPLLAGRHLPGGVHRLAGRLVQSRQAAHPVCRRFRLLAAGMLTLLTLLLPALELPWRQRPVFTGPRADHLVVIGDSISAGISADPPWPKIMQTRTGIPVTNLARAGDETSDAFAQSQKLTDQDTLVLIEIGGNDLIAGVPTAEFEARLDRLLAACAAPNRMLIMFELPLLPHRIGYGHAQRRLAAQYHVRLIPKRFFVEVLHAGTSDGLHCLPAGANMPRN